MLDFYTIDDNQVKPGFPENAGLVFAGLQMDTDVKSLVQILDIANNKQSGLIAYSD